MSEIIPIHKTPSIFDDLQDMQGRILQRAYEIFESTGGLDGRDLDHWLAAERELVWKPSVELREKDHEFQLRIAIPGIDPTDLKIELTPEDVLIKADRSHAHAHGNDAIHICEFESGKMLRSIHLPRKINPEKAKAEVRNGVLRLTAEIAEAGRIAKTKPEAA